MVRPYRRLTRRESSAVPVEDDAQSWYEALCTPIEDSELRKEPGLDAHRDVLTDETPAPHAEQVNGHAENYFVSFVTVLLGQRYAGETQ